MHRTCRLIAALSLALYLVGSCRRADDGRARLRIFAAASLTDLMSAVEVEYERHEPAVDLRFHFAGSNQLAEQLLAGARADLFIPASSDELSRVEKAGLSSPGASAALFVNHLVWVGAVKRSSQEIERFALADPEAVPAGRYARVWLEEIGEWDRIESKIAPSPSVRAALALLASGAAEEGVIYASDLSAAPDLSIVRAQESEESPAIQYTGAVLQGGGSHAHDFLRWLSGDPVPQDLAQQHGFIRASERP